MKPSDRDISILRHIVIYCQQIEQTIERFGDSAEIFATGPHLPKRRSAVYFTNR